MYLADPNWEHNIKINQIIKNLSYNNIICTLVKSYSIMLYILYIHLQYAKIIKIILGTQAQLNTYKLSTRSNCCHL